MLAWMLLLSVPSPMSALWPDAAGFTEAECLIWHGQRVRFTGTVADTEGGIDDLYPVYIDAPRNGRREWHCLLSRQDWLRVQPGQRVTVEGVLLLHDAEGGRYALLHRARCGRIRRSSTSPSRIHRTGIIVSEGGRLGRLASAALWG
jgi:hypothetical protein